MNLGTEAATVSRLISEALSLPSAQKVLPGGPPLNDPQSIREELRSRLRDEPKKEERPLTEEALERRLTAKLQELFAEHTGAIIANDVNDEKAESALCKAVRENFGLKADTKVTLKRSFVAAVSTKAEHRSQPWFGRGQLVVKIGEGDDAFTAPCEITLRAGAPAEIDVGATSWGIAASRKILEKSVLEGKANILNGEVSDAEKLRIKVASLALIAGSKITFSNGRRPQNETALLKDPSLADLGPVFTVISAEVKDQFKTFSLRTEEQQAEAAVWASRWLNRRGEKVTRDTVSGALTQIDALREKLSGAQLFNGRNVVVAADAQTLLDLDQGDERSSTARYYRARGDVQVFGTAEMVRAMRQAVGPDGDVQLVRAEKPLLERVEALLIIRSLEETLKNAASESEDPADPGAKSRRVLKTDFRELFQLREGDPLSVAVARDRKAEKRYTVTVRSAGELLGRFTFEAEKNGGKLVTDSVLQKDVVARASRELTPADAAEKALNAIRLTQPGKNGFLFVFDGHGNPDSLSLGSIAVSESGKVKGKADLSAEDIASAIIVRSKRYDTSKDIYLFESCFSKDFVSEVAERIKHLDEAPILISSAEHGQLGSFNPLSKIPAVGVGTMLRRAESASGADAPTLLDFMQLSPGSSGPLYSNPTFWIPGPAPKGKQEKGYDQISQGPGDERRASDT